MSAYRFVPAMIAGAALMAVASIANAAVTPVEFNALSLGQTVGSALGNGDGLSITGQIPATGALTNSVTFTLADNTGVDTRGIAFDFGPFSIKNFGLELFDSSNSSLGSAVISSLAGASFGTLHVVGLLAGESYRLAITGNVSGFGNYDVKVGITPVPGALLLLGPALAGLGFVGYRRSQTA
jgi:hypothetical protein